MAHRTSTRGRIVLMVGLALFAVALVVAMAVLIHKASPKREVLDLSVEPSKTAQEVTAAVDYNCDKKGCELDSGTVEIVVQGGGVKAPTTARLDNPDTPDVIYRNEGEKVIVNYDVPAGGGGSGSSRIDFACSEPGAKVQVKASAQTPQGEAKVSESGFADCPAR